MRRLVLVSLLAFSPACARELGPEAAYRSLLKASADRDADRAWNLLSRGSQKRLDDRARAAAARAPGVVAPSGRQLLLGDAALQARPAAAVAVLSQTGQRALLRVDVEGGPPQEVALVYEGRWRVELPER